MKTLVDVVSAKSILPVVNHGDCWNNNMMFSTDDAGNKKVVFFDLQV